MWEEAAKFSIFGVEIYAYGLYAALGALGALTVLCALTDRRKWPKGAGALLFLLSGALGFIFSRLFYCLLDLRLGGLLPLRYWPLTTAGGYSMMGLLLGACLGACLAARLMSREKAETLDLMGPAFLIFAVFERMGERMIPDFGISRPLIGDFMKGSFLAVIGEYDVYLATYLPEAAAMLILYGILWKDLGRRQKKGDTFLLFLILFGAVQTLLESLRFDQHLRISFVGLQQVMAIALLGVTVLYLALTRGKKKPRIKWAAILSVPLAVALGVALEFAIDRTNISRYLLYLIFALVLAVPAWLGIRLMKEGK